jgi:uncharacterized Tic20 family protein
MGRFQSKEEYERWRATQRGKEPPPAASEEGAAPAEQIYDGPEPGSQEFIDRSMRHAGLATDRGKNLGMLCHLLALTGFIIPFGNIFGPLVVWMMGKSESQFVDDHGKASLNFQLTLTLYFIGLFVLGFFVGGVVIFLMIASAIVLGLYGVIMIIVNAIKAHNGEDGEYAMSAQLLH